MTVRTLDFSIVNPYLVSVSQQVMQIHSRVYSVATMRVYVCDHEWSIDQSMSVWQGTGQRAYYADEGQHKHLVNYPEMKLGANRNELAMISIICVVYDHHPSSPCVGVSETVLGVGEGIRER